jgi:hypothetical protein
MTSKTISLSLLSVFAAVLLVSFASAGVVTLSALSSPSTASHNSDITVTFNLTYSGSTAVNTIMFNESTTNIGSWKTLPSPIVLSNNSVPVTLSAVLNVPNHAAGVVNAVLKADSMNTTADDSEPFSITISSSNSLSISSVQSMTKTHNATISVTNTGNTNLANINLSATGDFAVSFSSNNFALAPGSFASVNVNALEDLSEVNLGSHSIEILAKDLSTTASGTISYNVGGEFCDKGNMNTSSVKISNIDDTSSDDAWEWKPLDEVTVEVDVENNLNRDEDFVVELALYDSQKDNFIELDGENSIEQEVSIDEDDEETVSFEFVVPAEIESSEGRYMLYVKAYVDGKESTYCNSYNADDVPDSDSVSIVVDKNTHDVYLEELTASSDIVQAGDTVTISARAYNIGDNDEDKVKLSLVNTKLGLDLESSTFGLDMGDSNLVDFSFVVPYTAANGVYSLRLTSYFYYKKSSDTYSKSQAFDIKINVVGGSSTPVTSVQSEIAASLESEALSGEEMKVTSTITNTGTNRTTFAISVKGYESWATLGTLSAKTVTLDGGESKDISISFDVNKNATGEQTFTIESKSGSRVDSKEVAVEISESSFLSSLASSLGGKTMLWIIGIINIILIVLIIYLAVRIFRR